MCFLQKIRKLLIYSRLYLSLGAASDQAHKCCLFSASFPGHNFKNRTTVDISFSNAMVNEIFKKMYFQWSNNIGVPGYRILCMKDVPGS